jgi:hypothetical protein
VLRREKTLKSLLDDYKHFSGLGVHWVFMGPSGRKKRPREGGVLRHYRQCSGGANAHVKTIVNSFFVDRITGHPHNFFYRCAWPFMAPQIIGQVHQEHLPRKKVTVRGLVDSPSLHVALYFAAACCLQYSALLCVTFQGKLHSCQRCLGESRLVTGFQRFEMASA